MPFTRRDFFLRPGEGVDSSDGCHDARRKGIFIDCRNLGSRRCLLARASLFFRKSLRRKHSSNTHQVTCQVNSGIAEACRRKSLLSLKARIRVGCSKHLLLCKPRLELHFFVIKPREGFVNFKGNSFVRYFCLFRYRGAYLLQIVVFNTVFPTTSPVATHYAENKSKTFAILQNLEKT